MKAHELIINDAEEVCVPVMEIDLKPTPVEHKKALIEDVEYRYRFDKYLTTAVKLKDQEWGIFKLPGFDNTHPDAEYHKVGKWMVHCIKNHPYQVPEFEFEVKEEWYSGYDKKWIDVSIEKINGIVRRVAVIMNIKG